MLSVYTVHEGVLTERNRLLLLDRRNILCPDRFSLSTEQKGGENNYFLPPLFSVQPTRAARKCCGGEEGGDTKQKLAYSLFLWLSFEKRFWEAKKFAAVSRASGRHARRDSFFFPCAFSLQE